MSKLIAKIKSWDWNLIITLVIQIGFLVICIGATIQAYLKNGIVMAIITLMISLYMAGSVCNMTAMNYIQNRGEKQEED